MKGSSISFSRPVSNPASIPVRTPIKRVMKRIGTVSNVIEPP